MGKSKSPSLPPVPSYWQDPLASQSNQALYNTGMGLMDESYYQNHPGLAEAVNLNPQITQNMLTQLRSQLDPILRTSRQDTINQLEANNQLTGSTTANSLNTLESDYENRLIGAGAEAGIADINRALQNRVGLFGTGLNAVQSAGQSALTNQNALNSFNQSNYENQVAAVLNSQQNKGGLAGAFSGGLGGVMGAVALAPFTGGLSIPLALGLGAAGAAAGGFGPSGTGGALAQSGAGLYGARLASNNPYQTVQSNTSVYVPQYSNSQINDVLKTPSYLR